MTTTPEVSESSPASIGFTDAEGEVFRADASDKWIGESVITLSVRTQFDDEPTEIAFYKADATKIIALIAEAAK